MNKTGILHASSAWVTSVTLTAPSKFTAPRLYPTIGHRQPTGLSAQFPGSLASKLTSCALCAGQKAEQEQRRPDYTKNWLMPRENGSRIVSKWVTSSISPACSPNLRQLLLFLDDTGVIRLGKRIHNAPVSKSTKLLLFPPPKDPFTELDISDTYVNQLYACASSTLNLVRLRYWIPAGRQHVKKAINHCVTCKTIIGLPYNIADPSLLPKKRLP